jgi:hypothetical protein
VYATKREKEAKDYSRFKETPGAAIGQGSVLRHRLLRRANEGTQVNVDPFNWSGAYRAAQEQKRAGRLVRATGEMNGVLLMTKAKADRTLDRSTGRVRVPAKRPTRGDLAMAAAMGQPRPKVQRPRWNRRRKP